MKQISIDIETYSSVNLANAGVYLYDASDDFELLLFSYSIVEFPVKVIDLTQGETIPQEIVNALSNQSIIKSAFNAQFERVCLSAFLSTHLKPQGWHCSMVWSATLGLPLSLKAVGTVLGLDKQKLEEGKDLVRYFCTIAPLASLRRLIKIALVTFPTMLPINGNNSNSTTSGMSKLRLKSIKSSPAFPFRNLNGITIG